MSGAMLSQGGGKAPVLHTIPLNDVFTAALGAFGVAAALLHRSTTGEGQRVHVSLTKSSLAIQAVEFTRCTRFSPEVHAEPGATTEGGAAGVGTAAFSSKPSSRASGDDEGDASHAPDDVVQEGDVAAAEPTGSDADDGRAPPAGFLAGPCAAERVYRTSTAPSEGDTCSAVTHLFVEARTSAQREALLLATDLHGEVTGSELTTSAPRVVATMEGVFSTR